MQSPMSQEPQLMALCHFVEKNLAKTHIGNPVSVQPQEVITTPPSEAKMQKAAIVIQRFFRGWKIKQTILKSPYFSYLSTIDKQDDAFLLSAIMYGQHQAELIETKRFGNPFIRESAIYHRDDSHSGPLLRALLLDFKIDDSKKDSHDFIPITQSKNTPISDYLDKLSLEHSVECQQVEFITSASHTIDLLAFPKDLSIASLIREEVSASGFVATPWEIAANVTSIDSKILMQPAPQSVQIVMNSNLPSTKDTLLQSSIMRKLDAVAKSDRYATNKLAKSLKQLLENMPVLSPDAIKRISMMLDITHMFYTNNYSRYAFCVYTIIHEISLYIAKENSQDYLDQSYALFLNESKDTLSKALGTEPEQTNATYFSCPAMSGTNAYAIAVKLAKKMKTESRNEPTITVFKPSYYEFDAITKSSGQNDADIFAISTGPIVNPEGLTPGVDINLFVQRHFIDTNRTKPATIIIDATTTLYHNLALSEETKTLITEGKISIIIHESHQKFGLLHTDQAQYGRVFGLCSNTSFNKEDISSLESNGYLDFKSHIDMRIGAFISVKCSDTLEEIKKQHFSNGAILRGILSQVCLESAGVIAHDDMLQNLDELYFAFYRPSSTRIVCGHSFFDFRASFGHFSTVLVGFLGIVRISPDASDDIDCLLQASQFFLLNYYSTYYLIDWVIFHGQSQRSASLPMHEQIVLLAILNIISQSDCSSLSIQKLIALHDSMKNLVEECPILRGRSYTASSDPFIKKLRVAINAHAKAKEQCKKILAEIGLPSEQEVIKNEEIEQAQSTDDLSRIKNELEGPLLYSIYFPFFIANKRDQKYLVKAQSILSMLKNQVKILSVQSLIKIITAFNKYVEPEDVSMQKENSDVPMATDFLNTIIREMSPEIIESLFELLTSPDKTDTQNLFKIFQIFKRDETPESQILNWLEMQKFLNKYNIEVFPNAQNSKVLKLTHKIETTVTFVLKAGVKTEESSSEIQSLMGKFPNIFTTPSHTCKSFTTQPVGGYGGVGIQKPTTHSVQILPYVGPDIQSFLDTHPKNDQGVYVDYPKFKIISDACKIYAEMTDIISGFQEQGFAHTDIKNSNFLINKEGRLQIADIKGIMAIEDKDKVTIEFKGGPIFSDPTIQSPELKKIQSDRFGSCNVDKMHAFMLGKNLYQFLTGCSSSDLEDIHKNIGQSDLFTGQIFEGDEGRQLQDLIINLLQEDPKDRMSLSEVKSKFVDIQQKFNSAKFLSHKKIFTQVLSENHFDDTPPESPLKP